MKVDGKQENQVLKLFYKEKYSSGIYQADCTVEMDSLCCLAMALLELSLYVRQKKKILKTFFSFVSFRMSETWTYFKA